MIHKIDISPETFSASNGAKSLTKEDWQEIANGLCEAGPYLVRICQEMANKNPEITKIIPSLSPDMIDAYLQAAVSACAYVSQFAADQLKFIVVKDGEKN